MLVVGVTDVFILLSAETSGHSGYGALIRASKIDFIRQNAQMHIVYYFIHKYPRDTWQLGTINLPFGGISKTRSRREIHFEQHSSENFPLMSARHSPVPARGPPLWVRACPVTAREPPASAAGHSPLRQLASRESQKQPSPGLRGNARSERPTECLGEPMTGQQRIRKA